MSEDEAARTREALVPQRDGDRSKSRTSSGERRRSPRPRLAGIRRGPSLNLVPPIVVTGAVRIVEFLLVAALGFAIYLVYVERAGAEAHLVYLAAVLIAAAANTMMFQSFDLYRVPALSAFVRSFTRITLAWTLVVAGRLSVALFV